MYFEEAESRPFETIMSGPVAGATGAGRLCELLGIDRAIAADVGGTSFDTCYIRQTRPILKYEGFVAGMPLLGSWVDVRSIGAGGGSIAWVDAGGRLRVGPQSAGASPGPASYGRGGQEPTVTDAAALLGMLGSGELAGGLRLDLDAARQALDRVALLLSSDVEELARGVVVIAVAAMGKAIRSVTVEQGEDPRDAHLIAYGGAGPLLSTLLADNLDISTVVVPPHAGNFSAWGLLMQDIVRSTTRTLVCPLADDATIEALGVAIGELFDELEERQHVGSQSDTTPSDEASVDLRYLGQEHTMNVPVPWNGKRVPLDHETLAARFADSYRQAFGLVLDGPLEVVAVRAATRIRFRAAPVVSGPQNESRQHGQSIEAHSFRRGNRLEFPICHRSSLRARTAGPLIITEPTATTYVDDGWVVSKHNTGSLIITLEM